MPTTTVNGIKLNYASDGQGPPLLFIHGLGGSLEDWQPQVAHFTKEYRVIALDLRGHGRSDKPAGGYSMQLFASDIAALIKSLRLGPVHVVGISLGGGIAFQLAIDSPEWVRSLTIVNSGPEMILRTFKEKFAIWLRFAIIRTRGLQKLGEIVGGKLFPDPADADKLQGFLDRYARNEPDAYRGALRSFINWSVSAQIGTITCPTLIMAAEHDYTPVSLKEAYVKKIPKGKLVVIPGAHHAAPMEDPAVFNKLLAEFLTTLSS
jgi:3-oxoadipate enol-lactonase